MKLITTLLTAAAMTMGTAAMAHGPAKAQHGGIVQSAHDLSFELVSRPEGVIIYVDDHGKAKPTAGATGKLTVLHGKDKSETELTPSAENALEAKGVKIVKGDKLVATVTFADKETATMRFKAP